MPLVDRGYLERRLSFKVRGERSLKFIYRGKYFITVFPLIPQVFLLYIKRSHITQTSEITVWVTGTFLEQEIEILLASKLILNLFSSFLLIHFLSFFNESLLQLGIASLTQSAFPVYQKYLFPTQITPAFDNLYPALENKFLANLHKIRGMMILR